MAVPGARRHSTSADVYSDAFPYSVSACQTQSDTTPPTLNVPGSVEIDATSAAGATVNYVVSATDDGDPAPVVTCSPGTGTLFAIGDTTANCIAADSSGNTATASFVVHVRGATEELARLQSAVTDIPRGDGLAAIAGGVQRLVALGQSGAACTQLDVFQTLVNAASRAIEPGTADSLIASAKQIKTVLNC